MLSDRACLHSLDLLFSNSQHGEDGSGSIVCQHTGLWTEQAKFNKWKPFKGTVLALRTQKNR